MNQRNGKYVFEVDTRAQTRSSSGEAARKVIGYNVNTINVTKSKTCWTLLHWFLLTNKKHHPHLQLIQKRSSCSLLKLNNLRRKYREGVRVYKYNQTMLNNMTSGFR